MRKWFTLRPVTAPQTAVLVARELLGLVIVGDVLGQLITGPLAGSVYHDVDVPVRNFSTDHSSGHLTRLAQWVRTFCNVVLTGVVAVVVGWVWWRRTRDPYSVLVSEVMLQQTQVSRVTEYYARFLGRYPTIHALAAARPGQVREVWAGLGYYRRADNLHRLAQLVVKENDGLLPNEAAQLVKLPGVGRYTAGAIATAPFRNSYNDDRYYRNDGYDRYTGPNGFVCQPGTWFRGQDGRRHICQ